MEKQINTKRLIELAENLLLAAERLDTAAVAVTAGELRAFLNTLPDSMRVDHHGLRKANKA